MAEVGGGIATYVLATDGSIEIVDMPEFSEIRIPGPVASAFVDRNALKSTPVPAAKLPPVTVQLDSGIDPAGKPVIPDT